MLRVARCAISAILAALTLGGCRGPASPERPGVQASGAANVPGAPSSLVLGWDGARYLVVFAGDQAPPDFAQRVSALGGVVDTILDGVGLAVASGLTDPAARELRSAPGVMAVEPDLILGAEAADELAAADLGVADATEVAIGSSAAPTGAPTRSEEHTSELQSPCNLVCRLLLEKKKKKISLTKPCHVPDDPSNA